MIMQKAKKKKKIIYMIFLENMAIPFSYIDLQIFLENGAGRTITVS